MSQSSRILSMLRGSTDKTITCKELADQFLYHHASQRIGEMNGRGFVIKFVKGDTPMCGKYKLEFDPGDDVPTTPIQVNTIDNQQEWGFEQRFD